MLDCPLNCTNIGYFRTSQLSLAHRIAVCVRRLVSLFCAHTHATNPHGGECLFFLLSRSSTDTATTTILLRRLTLVPSRQGVVSNKHFCHIQEEARNRISPPCLFKQKFVYILVFVDSASVLDGLSLREFSTWVRTVLRRAARRSDSYQVPRALPTTVSIGGVLFVSLIP